MHNMTAHPAVPALGRRRQEEQKIQVIMAGVGPAYIHETLSQEENKDANFQGDKIPL